MKKFVSIFASLALMLGCLAGCGSTAAPAATGDNTTAPSTDHKLQIVATIFSAYDFARQVGGDNAEVTMLLPPGSESHSYEPTPQDIITIQNCDLFVYVGGESDSWVNEILESMDTPIVSVKMMDFVNIVEEELVEGMEEESHDAEAAASNEAAEEEVEYDEHVWTSPKNAIAISQGIAATLADIDSDNADLYTANSDAYTAQLTELDTAFSDFFSTVSKKMLIFGDRFPLRYFVEEYGLDYYAAFPGCSADAEPSAATVAFLVDKVKSENISTVFYIEFSNHLVADSIAEATGAKTALFQSCHNVSQADLDAGATYVSLMYQNLETLKGAMQ